MFKMLKEKTDELELTITFGNLIVELVGVVQGMTPKALEQLGDTKTFG